jgi:hypothetical protein
MKQSVIHMTIIHRFFAPIKRLFPSWLSNFIRSLATAIIGPIRFAFLSGYVRSSFKMSAVARDGSAVPWYTYPLIDFLKFRDFSNKTVLEFGGGQSTQWWASKASSVITLEGDLLWFEKIKPTIPANVDLRYVTMDSRQANVEAVKRSIESTSIEKFDIIVIDGLYRENMIDIALQYMATGGIIICDNAEGYGFVEGFKRSGLKRVDFFGNAPGVVLASCSCIYFDEHADIFSANYDIPAIYNNH